MRTRLKTKDSATARINAKNYPLDGILVRGRYQVVCRSAGGVIKWVEDCHNLVTNEGIDYVMRSSLLGSGVETQIGTWYVGLVSSTPTIAAADTMSSHAGWTEVHTQYSQSNRVTWTGADTGVGTASNSASVAVFSITGSVTVGGCFLTSNNTKNGTTGKLFSAVAFSGGNRAVVNTDSLEVTYNFSTADDGV